MNIRRHLLSFFIVFILFIGMIRLAGIAAAQPELNSIFFIQ
jgi:hypothetical protein